MRSLRSALLLLLMGCTRGAEAFSDGSVTVGREQDGLLHLSASAPVACDRISENVQATVAGKPMRRVGKKESELGGKKHCRLAFVLDDKAAPNQGKTLFEIGDGSRTARLEVFLFDMREGFELVEPTTLDGVDPEAVLRFRLKPNGRLREPSCHAMVPFGEGKLREFDCRATPTSIELHPKKLDELPKGEKQLLLSGIVEIVERCEGIGACIGGAPISMSLPIRYK